MNNNTYITSDTHFFHDRIRPLCNRPFSSAEEMNTILVTNINKTVSEKATLYHLGDIVWWDKKNYEERIQWFKESIICKDIRIITGNHDNVPILKNYFDFVEFYHEEAYNNRLFVMCHYPYASWKNKARGSINLHGHVHSLNQDWNSGLNRYDVGVDANNYAPSPIQSILDYFADKKNSALYP